MKIIILGAGQVGGTLAEHLADEQNDITVVDERAATLKRLQERLDIRTVLGNGAHPSALLNAGAEDADMLIAVTDSDEINMLACSVAFTLYRTPTKISRVRSADYLAKHQALFESGSIPVDGAFYRVEHDELHDPDVATHSLFKTNQAPREVAGLPE